jgi:hypothetical protein
MQDHPRILGEELMQCFEELADPRKQSGRFQYPLQELLLTALCAVAAGAEDWVDVSEWGEFKLEWLDGPSLPEPGAGAAGLARRAQRRAAQPSWRYYIGSAVLDAQAFNATIRAHWAIDF